jgi:hypothetical protein
MDMNEDALQLESAKEGYMLNVSIQALHRESLEWLQELDFMKDEAAFFYGLIIQKLETSSGSHHAEEMKSIEDGLFSICTTKLIILQDSVNAHELYLSKMITHKTQNDAKYRSQHGTLLKEMHDLERELRELKKSILVLIKTKSKSKKLIRK